MKKIIWFLLGLLITACTQEVIEPSEDIGQMKSAKIDELKNDRIIVKFKDQEKIQVLKDVKDIENELEKLAKDPKVEYAEPDVWVEVDLFPNDSLYQSGNLWNMYSENGYPQNQFGCKAIEAWNKEQFGSSDIYVAIIDQGYQYQHEDLWANVGVNPYEIPGNQIDDEGNGYIDDVYGWDFYNNDNSVFDGSEDFHGTHVAGTIGAMGNNQLGVAGVVWNVKFISIKFLGYYGGFISDGVKAIDYMIDLKSRGMNIVVANNSWGTSEKSRSLGEAMNRAETAGIIMVCAAGNNANNRQHLPASYRNKNVISVASINAGGNLSYFSNYGKGIVDIAAPGENITSTYAYTDPLTTYYAKYYAMSGTSMATPHVTGAVVLYKSLYPNATWQEIKQAILSKSIPTPSLAGKVGTGGRLDVSNF